MWRPDGDGTLVVTEWNKKLTAGSFELKIAAKDRKATMKGTFDLPCRQSASCAK